MGLIRRQAAIDEVKRLHDVAWTNWKETRVSANTMIDALKDLPSAEPEIIRCKDCLNWIPGYITDQDDFIPPKCGKYQQMVGHSGDDFCSFAERRTDG